AVTTGVNTSIVGSYGTLVLQANGSYTYQANANSVTSDVTDHFVYTIKDGDGDLSTITLDIDVDNVGVGVSDDDALVYEAGLSTGSNAIANSEIFNGTIVPSGGDGPYTYTLDADGDHNGQVAGTYGNLVLNSDGTYTYTLTSRFDTSPDANNSTNTEQDRDSFSYTVTDSHGNTTTGPILVAIVDAAPT